MERRDVEDLLQSCKEIMRYNSSPEEKSRKDASLLVVFTSSIQWIAVKKEEEETRNSLSGNVRDESQKTKRPRYTLQRMP